MFNTFAFRLSGKMRRRASLAVLLTAAAAPAFGQDRSTFYAPPSPYSSFGLLATTSTDSLDKSAIEQLNKRYEAAVMRGDVATIVAMYTDDALLLPSMLKGKKAIGGDWTKTFRQNIRIENLKDIITDVRPLASDVVLEIGNGSYTWISPGVPPQNISESYATIWQKVGGEWKINTGISIAAPSNVAAQNSDQLSQLDRQERLLKEQVALEQFRMKQRTQEMYDDMRRRLNEDHWKGMQRIIDGMRPCTQSYNGC